MTVMMRALCLTGLAAAAQAQTVSKPATLQAAPRLGTAQTIAKPALPPDMATRDRRLRAQLPAEQREWADRTAARKQSPEALSAAVTRSWPDLAQADSEALMFVVMAAAARNAEADLRSDMAAMRDSNAEKQAQRDQPQGGQPDALSEQSEMQSLRLQMAMDRQSKLMEALSNLMKKADDTQSAIIQNIK